MEQQDTIMRLSYSQLQSVLDGLAEAHRRAHEYRALISDHCHSVYGVDPSDVNNDQFIDSVDGGCGTPTGMSVKEFERSMREAIERTKREPS